MLRARFHGNFKACNDSRWGGHAQYVWITDQLLMLDILELPDTQNAIVTTRMTIKVKKSLAFLGEGVDAIHLIKHPLISFKGCRNFEHTMKKPNHKTHECIVSEPQDLRLKLKLNRTSARMAVVQARRYQLDPIIAKLTEMFWCFPWVYIEAFLILFV